MYEDNWNAYYKGIYQKLGKKALWDVPSDRAVALDREHFSGHFDPNLPVIDLGCGTGEQSVYLRSQYPHVVGVDVATVAVEMARKNHQLEGLEYHFLDATKPDMANELHSRIGDANVYMRGVLHQVLPEDQEAFQKALSILLGTRGHCYFNEVSSGIHEYFTQSSARFDELPERMRKVFISNLPPRGVDINKIHKFWPADTFDLQGIAAARLNTNLNFPDGEPIFIPSVRGLVSAVEK